MARTQSTHIAQLRIAASVLAGYLLYVVPFRSFAEPPGTAAEVTVVANFPANKGPGYRKSSPDAAGAVGPKHTVVLDDRGFVVQDKATGKVLQDLTQHDFWLKVEPAGTFDLHANDPRMLYDPITQRWFAWVQGLMPAHGYLAVSTSSDPTGSWKGIRMPFAPNNYGARIGFDKNGLYISGFNGKLQTILKAQNCYAIPMADAVAADGPSVANMQTFADLDLEAFPATDLDPDKAPDAPAVLLNKAFGDAANMLYLYKITWSGKTASISEPQTIKLSKHYPSPNGGSKKFRAVQPSPGVHVRADEGRRTLSVFARGGSVFGCNGAKRSLDARAGVLWYEVRISDGALLQEGFVDAPDCDYLIPSLAVDTSGNIGLGCTRTSENEFPSVYVMMHAAGDPPGAMRPAVRAVAGTTYFRGTAKGFAEATGWGNYSSTCVDPTDPNILWTCQEYAASEVENQWCTAWVAFRFSESKKPHPSRN